MDDEEEKPAGVVAYLAYVRILRVVSDKVRRQIVRYFRGTVALASKSRDVGASPSSIIK